MSRLLPGGIRENHVRTVVSDHKVRHPRCVYKKLDWSVCTCLTQLYDGM